MLAFIYNIIHIGEIDKIIKTNIKMSKTNETNKINKK